MDNIARTHLFQEMIELNKAWFLCSQGTPRSVGILVCKKYNKKISAEPLGEKFTSFQCVKKVCVHRVVTGLSRHNCSVKEGRRSLTSGENFLWESVRHCPSSQVLEVCCQ